MKWIWYFPLLLVPHVLLLLQGIDRKQELMATSSQVETIAYQLQREEKKIFAQKALWKRFGGKEVRKREEQMEKLVGLSFLEETIQHHPRFTEVTMKGKNPVVCSTEQLQQLLHIAESGEYAAICLLQECRLQRIEEEEGQSWLVEMKLVKRELL